MSKRSAETQDNAGQKRQKVHHHSPPEEVKSSEHLRQLLAFRQDAIAQLLAGIRSFKVLLESIVYAEDKNATYKEQLILTGYLREEGPKHGGDLPLEQLFQAWSFAGKVNHDSLSSAIPAILALLLKTISHILELREVGLDVGIAVLREEQLRLITRGLGVAKEKEHIISPCLRLLSETATFDGGSLTRDIHKNKAATLDAKLLTRCLTLGSAPEDGARETQGRPTVRANCIRYLLQLLKFSPSQSKGDVLRSSSMSKALFSNLKQDTPVLLADILGTVRDHILKDDNVSRQVKIQFLSSDIMSNVASLYRADRPPSSGDYTIQPSAVAHEFLRFACTTPGLGLLRHSFGFYPPGTDVVDDEEDDGAIDLGLDSIPWNGKYDGNIPVSNGHLSCFIRALKPYASLQECEMIMSIFDAAPELVADYFRNTKFALDPKLTATWIGYVAFLLSTIQTRVPQHFGHRGGYRQVPPPTSIVIDNIMPVPMNQKVLIRCLNQSSDLITFSMVRVLIASFQKLRMVLRNFEEAEKIHGFLWREGRQRLLDAFMQRCPGIRDVIGVYQQKAAGQNSVQREALLSLLRQYYEVLPQAAAEHRFDASLPLTVALSQQLKVATSRGETTHRSTAPDRGEDELAAQSDAKESQRLNRLELGHLLSIAAHTPDTRWFHKPEALPYSPFICLIKLQATAGASKESMDLLRMISELNDLQPTTLDALIASLMLGDDSKPAADVYEWLDEVVQRYVRKPIKYQDDLDQFPSYGDDSIDAIWMALIEQLPFALERYENTSEIVSFLSRFLEACKLARDDNEKLARVHGVLLAVDKLDSENRRRLAVEGNDHYTELSANWQRLRKKAPTRAIIAARVEDESNIKRGNLQRTIEPSAFEPPQDPGESKTTLTALRRITSVPLAEFTESTQSGDLSRLILCLSSSDRDVQPQALSSIRQLVKKLGSDKDAAHPECLSSKQLWLLLGNLMTTATEYTRDRVPYVITAFAALAAPILTDPTNPLYGPINKFLLKSPKFQDDKILRYWLHRSLREPPPEYRQPRKPQFVGIPGTDPEEPATQYLLCQPMPLTALAQSYAFPNDPYHTGIHFLLSYLWHATCTSADVDVLRCSSNVLESVLAIAGSDNFLPRGLRELVVALIWRITSIDGGSTMLITRVGIVSWLSALIYSRGAGKGPTDLVGNGGLKQLLRRVWETCEKDVIRKWDGGYLGGLKGAMGEEVWETADNSKAEGWVCGVEMTVRTVAGYVKEGGGVDGGEDASEDGDI